MGFSFRNPLKYLSVSLSLSLSDALPLQVGLGRKADIWLLGCCVLVMGALPSPLPQCYIAHHYSICKKRAMITAALLNHDC